MNQHPLPLLCKGGPEEIPVEETVPRDIVILNAGDIVPGNCLVQESNNLFADESPRIFSALSWRSDPSGLFYL